MRRDQLVTSMKRLAEKTRHAFPDVVAHQHVSDAADLASRGQDEGAQRHLRAAADNLKQSSVSRYGVTDDTSHMSAHLLAAQVARHALLLKNASDTPDEGGMNPALQLTAAPPASTIELVARARREMSL